MTSAQDAVRKLVRKHEQLATWMRRQAANLLDQAERHDRRAAQLRTHLDKRDSRTP